jgi:hypothetical protein
MKQAVARQECLRHNVVISGCPRTRNEGGEGLGKERSKIWVESVDRKPQLGDCLRQMKEGCGSATDGETPPSDLDFLAPLALSTRLPTANDHQVNNNDLTLAARDKLCPPPSGGRHRMTDDER